MTTIQSDEWHRFIRPRICFLTQFWRTLRPSYKYAVTLFQRQTIACWNEEEKQIKEQSFKPPPLRSKGRLILNAFYSTLFSNDILTCIWYDMLLWWICIVFRIILMNNLTFNINVLLIQIALGISNLVIYPFGQIWRIGQKKIPMILSLYSCQTHI